MWNPPNQTELSKIPALYHNQKEKIALKDIIIHEHFFINNSDWYIAEYDGDDTFFGFAILNGDLQMGEWGYISLQQLNEIKVQWLEVDRDQYWEPVPAHRVEKIATSLGWQIE